MKLKHFLLWIFSLILTIAAAVFINYKNVNSLTASTELYMETAYKAERGFIENIPVYRDFATPAMAMELQSHDLGDSAVEAARHKIIPLKNIDDINANVKNGKLVPLNTAADQLFYFHNVRKEYRYLTPSGKAGLELVAERYQKKLQARKAGLPVVKLAVSSVIRTVDYQEKIFGRKFVSTHSYGGCFDIFFDDYFVQLPLPLDTDNAGEKMRKILHSRMGFLMGDALREQLRTVLAETLLELQREKKIYVFLEEENRCYHITVLAD